MSPEFIAIIATGVAVIGLILTLNMRLERRMDRMYELRDQMEGRLTQGIDRLEDETKRRFDGMDTRLQAVEQSQSHLSGEMATLREAILLQPAARE